MSWFRSVTLTVLTVFAIQAVFEDNYRYEYQEWVKNFTAGRTEGQLAELFDDAKATIEKNILHVGAKNGTLLKRFNVPQAGDCAMACGLIPNCHFINIVELGQFRGHDCWLFTETGPQQKMQVASTQFCKKQNQIEDITEWLNWDRRRITKFVEKMLK